MVYPDELGKICFYLRLTMNYFFLQIIVSVEFLGKQVSPEMFG